MLNAKTCLNSLLVFAESCVLEHVLILDGWIEFRTSSVGI
jgi:hypothetical protein